jgi:RimJ/RimL family protein N-acetyltransferase
MAELIHGQDRVMAAWAAERIEHLNLDRMGPYVAIGVALPGRGLIAACLFHTYRPLPHGADIELSYAADSPLWATRSTIRGLLAYPFIQLGCARVTTMHAGENVRAQRVIQGLGWRREGIARRAHDGRDDLHIFGLLREEASERWFQGTLDHAG